ncbi:MAG: hypothetical protein GYB37_15555 [Algicola sp.]|nr:hypothetical protein [Algicola sp.]
MKKAVLAVCAVAIIFLALSFENPKNEYPNYLSDELITFFESEYLTTIENESLNSLLEKNFSPLFDNVDYVHAQESEEFGHYYIIYAKKDGEPIIELLKINESDIQNETYTYIDFSNIDVNNQTTYCRQSFSTYPGTCPAECKYYLNGCLGMSCAVYINGQCVIQ